MQKIIQNVLDKVIVPSYPEIDSVMVLKMGLGDYYRISYILNSKISYESTIEIQEETAKLYKMLGPERKSDIIIDFHLSE